MLAHTSKKEAAISIILRVKVDRKNNVNIKNTC